MMFELGNHAECETLSSLFRGSLCAQFTARRARSVDADETIYHIGDESHRIYYLRSGLVKVVALSADGREIILDIHKPGAIFGLFCMCGSPRPDSAVAMEPSDVVEITLAELVDRLQQNADVLQNFIVTVCQRLSKAYDTIQDLSFDNLPARLAKALLRLADDMGHEVEGGVELEHYITQEELAQMLSARREVVSTALGRMRDSGLVEYTRRGKLTINRGALEAFVDHSADAAAADRARPSERTLAG